MLLRTRFFFLTLLIFFSTEETVSQSYSIFDNQYVHEIRMHFGDTDYWQDLTDNFELGDADDIKYVQASVNIDGNPIDSIGVKFKGFTSYINTINKRPFKLDFNTYNPDQRYDGLRKVNLNVGFADPGMQRDFLAYELLRSSGIKAPRISYCKLYINDIYWGLYQIVEQIDKEFVQRNFIGGEGNLYKNNIFSHLEWEGDNASDYQPTIELKTNEEEGDWTTFIDFVDVINNTSSEDFPIAIDSIFNVDAYLKNLVVDVAINNWDSHLFFGRNFYLYYDDLTEKINWVPWDYNLSFSSGGFGVVGDGCEVNADFVGFTNGTTSVAFHDLSDYNTDVHFEWEFGDGNVSSEKDPVHNYQEAGTYEVCLKILISEDCIDELCLSIDTGRDISQCGSIVNGSFPNPVDYLFQKIVESRATCCDFWDSLCEDRYENLVDRIDGINFITFNIDQRENEGILINRLLAHEPFYNKYLNYFCEFLNETLIEEKIFSRIEDNYNLIQEEVALDSNFLYTQNQFNLAFQDEFTEGSLKYYIRNRIDTLRKDLDSLIACDVAINTLNMGDLRINEFMAFSDESSGIIDPSGQAEDWIEIYNPSEDSIDLSYIFISDKGFDFYKWKLPEGTVIGPKDYLIIWADDDLLEDGLHSNFRLKKEGEELYLRTSFGEILDSITFQTQELNKSSARIPNGIGPFVILDPTFGVNNETPSIVVTPSSLIHFKVFPNPAQNEINVLFPEVFEYDRLTIELYDLAGKKMNNSAFSMQNRTFDVSSLDEGMYFLSVYSNGKSLGIEKFAIIR